MQTCDAAAKPKTEVQAPEEITRKLFEITPSSDYKNRTGWDIYEYNKSFNEDIRRYRWDINPTYGRDKTTALLRCLYPGCKIRVTR